MIPRSLHKHAASPRALLRLHRPEPESVSSPTGKPGKAWIAVYFPRIALSVFDVTDDLPRVVIEETGGRQRIHSACHRALAQGVMSGMPLNAAHALCHGLTVHLRDASREERWLRALLGRAGRFTPKISQDHGDTLLLDVSASLRLFNGFESLYREVIREFGGQAVVSSAPSPSAATLLARNGLAEAVSNGTRLRSVLGKLAIADCGLGEKLTGELAKCGLRNLRDLWRLPRPDLARRFGTALVDFLDRVCAERLDPVKPMVTITRFYRRIELPVETVDSEPLQHAANLLMEHAIRFLRERGSVAEKLLFRLWYRRSGRHRDRGPTHAALVVRSQRGGHDPGRFMPQFSEILARTPLIAEVESVSLRIDQVIPCSNRSDDLFHYRPGKMGQGQQDWDQLLDILMARLGEEQIYAVSRRDDHRPERAWSQRGLEEMKPASGGQRGSADQVGVLPERPCWLLREPTPIRDWSGLELDGEGERIEAGWWDGGDVRRDYHSATPRTGGRCWVYRDLDGCDGPSRWFLHGFYG